MIDLTPLDVRNKRGDFKKGMRGYDPQEVDVFLELVAERLEALVRENIQLRDRTQTLQQQVDAQSGREQAVQDALVTAQELRKDIRDQSQREADHVIREAESEARRMIAEAEAEVRSRLRGVERQMDQVRDSLHELERRRGRFLQEFRSLLQRELDVVEVEEDRKPLEERTIDLDLGASRASGSRGTASASGAAAPGTGAGTAESGSGDGGRAAEDTTEARPAGAPVSSTEDGSGDASSSQGGEAASTEAASSGDAPGAPRSGESGSAGTGVEGDAIASAEVDDPAGSGAGAPSVGEVQDEPAQGSRPEASATGPGSPSPDPSDVPAPSSVPGAGSPHVVPEERREVEQRREVLDADVGELADRGQGKSARPSAPPPQVGDTPSSLELELMAGAAGRDAGDVGGGSAFPDVPDLETVLAEAGIDEVKPPEAEEISPPPAQSSAKDHLALFGDDEDQDDDER